MTDETKGPEILGIITKIKREVGALAPEQKSGVPFPFRGIDGVVNHLNAKINEYGVVTTPNVVESTVTARETGNRVVKTAHLRVEFTFYAPDGSSITATTEGLADDFADRAVAQAQSVAFRIALLQTFFLPTQSPEPEQTGQAVQDGIAAGDEPQQNKAIKAATGGSTQAPKPTGSVAAGVADLRNQIIAKVAEIKGASGVEPNFTAIGKRQNPNDLQWANKVAPLKAVLKAVESGQVE